MTYACSVISIIRDDDCSVEVNNCRLRVGMSRVCRREDILRNAKHKENPVNDVVERKGKPSFHLGSEVCLPAVKHRCR